MSLPNEALDPTFFLIVDCPACARSVLTARDLDDDGALVDICLHCETVLAADDPSARWLDAQSVLALGYFVDGVAEPQDDDGCSTGGCNGGSCGVQQPSTGRVMI